ncbi:ATP-binding protein [Pseudomonas sp. RW10S2]|uniref:ATP-binding protein n=1 Tax=Pseudomonas sp. RW10S2 TaxID=459637 RepID=UPI0032098470
MRFAEQGSVIEVTAGEQGDEVLIQVRNRGQAIAPEHLESVFERFYRVDASRQHSSQSSGLGLSIVRSIMQLHQGHCWAESSEGSTCFTLAFPRVSHDRPPSP